MIVYHGSDVIVKPPDIKHSDRPLDFGPGFYVTSILSQAQNGAKRKALSNRKYTSVINVFEYTELPEFKIMDFADDLESWLDFVCNCRSGLDDYKSFDVIKGKVADDKVFRVVSMYKKGFWEKERTINEMKVYDIYNQITFITQNAIDKMLSFRESFEIEINL